jgi:ribosomal protein S27E
MSENQAKRPRGRPPRPEGPTPAAEIARAYRARRKAAGKVVRVVCTNCGPQTVRFADMGKMAVVCNGSMDGAGLQHAVDAAPGDAKLLGDCRRADASGA